MKSTLLVVAILLFAGAGYGQASMRSSGHSGAASSGRSAGSTQGRSGRAVSARRPTGFRHFRNNVGFGWGVPLRAGWYGGSGPEYDSAPLLAENDGSFVRSKFLDFGQAVALGKQQDDNLNAGLSPNGDPMPGSAINMAEVARAQQAEAGKAVVFIHQDANGNIIVTPRNP